MPLFDSHCHLEGDDPAQVDATVARALAAGVGRMVHIGSGYGPGSGRRALAVAERHPEVWASIGVHPHDAQHFDPSAWDEMAAELAEHPRVVAFGEMGLDFHYDHSPRDLQRAALRHQLRSALAHHMPIIIHDRESRGEVYAILQEEGAFRVPVVWHCFTGTVADMEQITAAGGLVSIPGIVTYKTAGGMRQVAAATPLDRLLIETDSPFLAPIPHRGRRNEPAHVGLVARAVAAERGMSAEDLIAATWANANRFFGLAEGSAEAR
jgi:TatD DNase family protein